MCVCMRENSSYYITIFVAHQLHSSQTTGLDYCSVLTEYIVQTSYYNCCWVRLYVKMQQFAEAHLLVTSAYSITVLLQVACKLGSSKSFNYLHPLKFQENKTLKDDFVKD
uniref:SJCHGC09104 protein n=1 Tax=Schistosoma japonicum TaxID=6182 RepID=Q5DAZ3_SCHJA|nr:SJCHGC09104 protein [Schistosoma japonicum]